MLNLRLDNRHVIKTPDKDSSCAQWKAFFNQIKPLVGEDNARLIYMALWKHQEPYSCQLNSEYNNWADRHKVGNASMTQKSIASLSSGVGKVANIFGTSLTMGKLTMIAIPTLILIALAGGLIWTLRNPEKAGNLAMGLTPQTRILKRG